MRLLDAHLLECVRARCKALLLFVNGGLDTRQPGIEFRLDCGELFLDQLDAGVPFARFRAVALGTTVASEHFIADARAGLGQITGQDLDLRRVLGLDARPSRPLRLQGLGQPGDLLFEGVDTRREAGVHLLGAGADLVLYGGVAVLEILLDSGLVPAGDVVRTDQLLDEGRGDVERDRDDTDPHQQTEEPARAWTDARLIGRVAAA